MIFAAKTENLDNIAKLHTKLIGGSSSSMFGLDFVHKFYSLMLKDTYTHVWAIIDKKNVIGLICTTENMGRTFKLMRKNLNLKSVVTIILKLIVNPKSILAMLNRAVFELKLSTKIKNYPNIISIAVSDKFQGRGYGIKLLKVAEKNFKKNSYKRYYVDTEVSNTKAVNFYKKFGFKEFFSSNGHVCLEKKL